MSLLKNLIDQVKAKEKLNYHYFINNIRTVELDRFYKECNDNNQKVYPTWKSIEVLSSRKKNNKQEIRKNNISPETVIVIDDDNSDRNYIYRDISRNNINKDGVSSRTRSKTQLLQISLDNFIFSNNTNNPLYNTNISSNEENRIEASRSSNKKNSNKRKKNSTNDSIDLSLQANESNNKTSSKRKNPFAHFYRGKSKGSNKKKKKK